ncbi:MAG: CPBP family intramembrane glutamic endopeptidase, partial [Bacteroidota bacterium]
MQLSSKTTVLLSPFLIIVVNILVSLTFGSFMGKWVFIPIILIEWCLFAFFIWRFGGKESIKKWLQKPKGSWGWNVLAMVVGFLPLSLFLLFYETLNHWTVWVPWLLLAVINPWLEEGYWRGLLGDFTAKWKTWLSVLFCSSLFSMNHAVFGIYSEVNSGFDVLIATFVMGVIWAWVYAKTRSLRWCIASHFLVDFLNLSAPAFLDFTASNRG